MAYENQRPGDLWVQRGFDNDYSLYVEIYSGHQEDEREIGTVLKRDGEVYLILITREDESLVFPLKSFIALLEDAGASAG